MKQMTDTELSTRIAQFMQRKSLEYPELLSKYAKSRQDDSSIPYHNASRTGDMRYGY